MYTALKKSGRVREHPEFGHRLSDGMICRIHYTLHRALDDAVAAHLIPSNPTEDAVVPKPNSKPMYELYQVWQYEHEHPEMYERCDDYIRSQGIKRIFTTAK